MKIKCVDSRVNVHNLASTSVSYTPTTVQVPNFAPTYKKWITVYKKIQNGAVAKSYMTNGFLIYGEIFAHFLTYCVRKPFLIYDFATAPL